MAHLLHIDSSPRGDRSVSRTLTQDFVTNWLNAHPQDTVTYRDLGHQPVPFITEEWIAASFSDPATHTENLKEAIAVSNQLVEEFIKGDLYVMGLPMYNFSVTASFKAYIDQILRPNLTFKLEADGSYKGLMTGRKVLVITARSGSYPPNTPYAAFDFQEPYLRTVFGFIGITDIRFVHADNLGAGEDISLKSIANGRSLLKKTIGEW